MASEISDFKQHLEEIRQSHQELQRTFERGRRDGLWNPSDLQEYNRALQDHKRHLADVERQHKAIARAKEEKGSSARPDASIGARPGASDYRHHDTLIKKEREILRIKENTSKQLEIHERRQRNIANMANNNSVGWKGSGWRSNFGSGGSGGSGGFSGFGGSNNSVGWKGSGSGGWGGYAARSGGGATGGGKINKFRVGANILSWAYNTLLESAEIHTEYEMARGATEKLGGDVFSPGKSITPTAAQRRELEAKKKKELQSIPPAKDSFWRRNIPYAWLATDKDRLAKTAAIEAKYKKLMGGKRIPGEMGQYESYGMQLGYSISESHQLAQGGLRALPRNQLRDMKSNLAMYRGYTLDPGVLSGYHSAARMGGYEGGSTALNQQLIGAFTKGKFPRALMGEFVSAATDVLNTMSSSGGVVNHRTAPHMLAVYSRALGQGYQDSPFRTARLLGTLHQGIASPNGGDAGRAFVMRSLGLGSGQSHWDTLKRMHEGATPENIRDILNHGSKHLGKEGTLYALHGVLGVKPAAAENLYDAHAKGLLSPEMINKQVALGKNPDLESVKGLRLGFRQLELEKLAERAKIAASHVAAVTKAYELQILVTKASAEAISALTFALDKLLAVVTLGKIRLQR